MGMNPPGGSQDDLVVKASLKSDAQAAEKAGQADGEAYAKGLQKGMEKAGTAGQSNVPGMPGGAQTPGRGSAAQSLYGAESKWRTSGQLPERPNAPASQGLTAADIAASGRSVPAEEMSPETARQRRAFLAETQRVSGQIQRRQLGETTQEFQDRQKAATRAERDTATRESQFQRRGESIQGAAAQALAAGETEEARGAGRAAKYEQRSIDEENASDAAAKRELLQGFYGVSPAEQAENKTVSKFQTQADRRAKAQATAQARADRAAARAQAIADRESAKQQQIQDRQLSAEEQGIAAPNIVEGDRGIAAGRYPSDLGASMGGTEAAGGMVAGGGIPTSRFGYASYRAQQAMKGGFGPGARALTYGMSAVGQAILLGAPLINSFEGGAFGNLPIVGPYAQGDLQAQQALYEQQNQERVLAAATTYQRATYGIGVQQTALGVARGREQQQYGFGQQDIARTSFRQQEDYARSTAQLQRQAFVDQRSYARSSADLETKRAVDERNYSRQVEDTQHSRMKLEQDFQRHYEDFTRQRTDIEVQASRRREDIIRSLVDSTVTYTRGLQDISRQRSVVETNYARQQQDFARQTETATIGYNRQSQDLAISSGRANEDYARDRSRAEQQVADTARIRQLESQTLLRDQRNQVSDIGMEQFQSIGSLMGAAQSGDPFSIIGSLYRMQQLSREKKIIQGNISRGGFTEVQQAQQGIENRQQGQTLTDLDTQHARQQQDVALAQSRNAEDYKRQLDEIGIQQKRSVEDEKRNLTDLDIQEKRLGEDRSRSVEALNVQWQRAAEDEKKALTELGVQERRFYQDYDDNLRQIAKDEQRHWQDYAENIRQIGISQQRLVEDRLTQIQDEMRAQSALDVGHARAIEDLTIQQQRMDIAHAQATADFALQETALYVARAQAEEDFRKTVLQNAREREQNEIAANKEMRSMWEQLAISLGLAGIFSSQIVGSVKYLATFLGTIIGGGGVAAAAAAARGAIGGGSAAAGDISIGPSQMGTAATTGATGAVDAIGVALAGIGLTPAAIQAVTDIIKESAPNFAGFGYGTPVAQAAEIQQGSPGGYSPMANSQGIVQGSQSEAYGSAGVPPNPMNTHTGGEPGGYSGLGTDQYGTVNSSVPYSALSDTPGGPNQSVVDAFGKVGTYSEKVKGDFANTKDTSGDIQKRFSDSYAYVQGIKDDMGKASDASTNIKNTLNDAGITFAQAMARAEQSAGGSGGGSDGGMRTSAGGKQGGPDNSEIRDEMQKSYGDPRGGMLPDLRGGIIGGNGTTVTDVPENYHRADRDARDIASRVGLDQTTLEERQYLAFHNGARNGAELGVTYADWLAVNRPPNPAPGATAAGTQANAGPRPTPAAFGFRSVFGGHGSSGVGSGGNASLSSVTGGTTTGRSEVSQLTEAINGLRMEIQGNGGTKALSAAAMNNHIRDTMNQWVTSGMLG